MEDRTKTLEEISKPVVAYLKNNYDIHCEVVISATSIRLVRDEIGIPIRDKEAPEVPAQEHKRCIIDYGSSNFKFIKLFNEKELYDEAFEANRNNVGLVLTPEVLKMSQIDSIENIFMLGILEDK